MNVRIDVKPTLKYTTINRKHVKTYKTFSMNLPSNVWKKAVLFKHDGFFFPVTKSQPQLIT